ncbi:MAG TPA: hypothetical protein VJY35_10600 [Candidatus Eisenbacteria bacterium]|nr:hypothetical protein [Candidatus Eisenbacteria bacterium]
MKNEQNIHDLINRAIHGKLHRRDLAGLHPATASLVRPFLWARERDDEPHASPSTANNPAAEKLSREEEIARDFVREIGSDRLRDWWTSTYTLAQIADWLANKADEVDLLGINSLSAAGFDLAQRYRAEVAEAKHAERDAELTEKRASMSRARAVKQAQFEERLAAADPASRKRMLAQQRRNARKRDKK